MDLDCKALCTWSYLSMKYGRMSAQQEKIIIRQRYCYWALDSILTDIAEIFGTTAIDIRTLWPQETAGCRMQDADCQELFYQKSFQKTSYTLHLTSIYCTFVTICCAFSVFYWKLFPSKSHTKIGHHEVVCLCGVWGLGSGIILCDRRRHHEIWWYYIRFSNRSNAFCLCTKAWNYFSL